MSNDVNISIVRNALTTCSNYGHFTHQETRALWTCEDIREAGLQEAKDTGELGDILTGTYRSDSIVVNGCLAIAERIVAKASQEIKSSMHLDATVDDIFDAVNLADSPRVSQQDIDNFISFLDDPYEHGPSGEYSIDDILIMLEDVRTGLDSALPDLWEDDHELDYEYTSGRDLIDAIDAAIDGIRSAVAEVVQS